MAIHREELKELTSLKRKHESLKKRMDDALVRGADMEYSRYKREYDAISRTLEKRANKK